MVWGTGQVRCTWHLQDINAHQVVRFLIRRAHLSFGEAMANRSIARIYYAENNSPISMDMLPAVPPIPRGIHRKELCLRTLSPLRLPHRPKRQYPRRRQCLVTQSARQVKAQRPIFSLHFPSVKIT
ncbi:hypothetical protein A0H81_02254 [Grifola frondosa]|uniref:Uncharacterized protein n=1 Tax=Grifola frondosa TaxID=5627 RepID=A0A1C7MLR6_GRIFR|nr:hypothetical protein A0H81_02254 [Grifola frondosa]